ncbi:hypothetical protein OIV19_18450 [Brucella sp. HL-2]|nr:hypothetical protein [Brucella sp. HL-2]MCV9909585.1 hypothetical protein [Brucella sp. HL-2]
MAALADQNPFSQLREGVYREDCAQKSDSIFIIEKGGDKISGIDKSCKFSSAKGTSVTLQCTDEDGDKYVETYNVKVNSQTSFGVWMTGYDPYEYLLCKG